MKTERFPRKGLTQMQTVAVGYVVLILIGAVLLTLPVAARDGRMTSPVDAFMTSTSAVCVTGLIPVGTYTHWSLFGQITILLLIQIGGIGIMTTVALFARIFGRSMSLHERKLVMLSSGQDSLGGVSRLIRDIALFTLLFELAGAALLAVRFIPTLGAARGIWFSVFHSVSAFCNAGFDLMGFFGQASLTGFTGDVLVNVTIMALILAGGLGFIVWQDLFSARFRFKKLSLHSKLVLTMTGTLFLFGGVLFFLFERRNPTAPDGIGKQILAALFDSVTPRTAGFNTVDTASLTSGSTALTILLMIIGGAPGSTAGGIKVTTLVVLLTGTLAAARNTDSVNLFRRRVADETIHQASAIVTVYGISLSAATVAICAIEPFSHTEVFFEAVSALSNVGMSMGITGSLTVASKLILSLLMYFGRVGMLSLAIALTAKRENLPVLRPTEPVFL